MHQDMEEARLDALYRLDLLDTPPSESFDRITRMAGQIFGLPIAAVSHSRPCSVASVAYRASHAWAPTTIASIPVCKVGWMTGANIGL
jgi:hypothetical protein